MSKTKRKGKQKGGQRPIHPEGGTEIVERIKQQMPSTAPGTTYAVSTRLGSPICYVCDKFVPRQSQQTTPSDSILDGELSGLLKTVGTGLWRLRQSIERFKDSPPADSLERVSNHLESIWMRLEQTELEIIDHTGQDYQGGEALRVEMIDSHDYDRDQVIETIKPTIRYKGSIVQVGEVIVGKVKED